jgi:hypothetical protein
MAWHGMAWFGWYGMTWFGWYGMTWYTWRRVERVSVDETGKLKNEDRLTDLTNQQTFHHDKKIQLSLC